MLNGKPGLRRILVVPLALTFTALTVVASPHQAPAAARPVIDDQPRHDGRAVHVAADAVIAVETSVVTVVPKPLPPPPPPPPPLVWLAQPFNNGDLPGDVLVPISFSPDEMIRLDAGHALDKLNAEFCGAFGRDIALSDGYRSYGEQVAVKRNRGWLAAKPGYSNHGLGIAVDIEGLTFGSAEYGWLTANGPRFGWSNPPQYQAGGQKPEAWHWEYHP